MSLQTLALKYLLRDDLLLKRIGTELVPFMTPACMNNQLHESSMNNDKKLS